MSNWYPQAIAAIATKGGFIRPHIVTATAVSWAATQGADHTDLAPMPIPEMMTRGLWGIQRSLVTDDEWDLMLDPTQAAIVAHRLWADAGGNFEWHPVMWSNTWQDSLALVTAALDGRKQASAGRPGRNFHQGLRDLAAHARAMNDARKR